MYSLLTLFPLYSRIAVSPLSRLNLGLVLLTIPTNTFALSLVLASFSYTHPNNHHQNSVKYASSLTCVLQTDYLYLFSSVFDTIQKRCFEISVTKL